VHQGEQETASSQVKLPPQTNINPQINTLISTGKAAVQKSTESAKSSESAIDTEPGASATGRAGDSLEPGKAHPPNKY
jgi:hypothetical protein